MNNQEEHAHKIKKTIEDIIGSNTNLKRRKKTEEDINKVKFESIINTLEEVEIRAALLEEDFKLGFSSYDEKFFIIIDALLELHFGKECVELINFYLFGRINQDGTENHLIDSEGNPVLLNDTNDLWELIQHHTSKKK